MNPLALPQPLDQSRLTQDAQMARHPRLALGKSRGEVRDAEVALAAEEKEPQTARLTRRAQPRDQLRTLLWVCFQ